MEKTQALAHAMDKCIIKTANLSFCPKFFGEIQFVSNKIMSMKFYVGGYYLIEGTATKKWMRRILFPPLIFTPSSCICDLHPEDICLSWVSGDKAAYQEKLGLTNEQFKELSHNCDDSFNREKYGWRQMFLDLEEARWYCHQWLNRLPNIKLVAIATTKEHREKFLEEEKHKPNNRGAYGNALALKQMHLIDVRDGLLGYEVLGFEDGSFHSFICYSFENDFSEKLGIQLNENGLPPKFEEAYKAAEYVQGRKVGTGAVLWQPWAIVELPKTGAMIP